LFRVYKSPMLGPKSLLGGLMVALSPGALPRRHRPDPKLYPEPPRNAVTFWGHACAYVDVGGLGIVTDPVFGSRYSPFHGRRIPTPPPDAYRRARIILISHAHQDHLQPRTLTRFRRGCTILCPAPAERYVRGLGPKHRVLRLGEEHRFPGGQIIAVPAYHPGGRYSRRPTNDGRALGFVIETPEITIYYSGDTEYFSGFEQIGRFHRPDLAILNVNAHLLPRRAVQAARVLGVSRVIPAHTGAYGGRAGRLGRRLHREFLALAGPLAAPLRVGRSLGFDRMVGSTAENRGISMRFALRGSEAPAFRT